ncbi:hypothetical protein SVIOM342S_02120 [Streptomyces violaceorubidus]
MHGQPVGLDARAVEAVEDGPQGALAAVAGDPEGEGVVVAGAVGQCRGGVAVGVGVGEAEPDVPARDEPLEFLGGAFGGDPPVVQHGDAVGEFVGLRQVLGGEEDGDAAGDEFADDLPHVVAGAGVEAGGGLVEEDDPGAADQGHGDVEAALHAAGVGGGGLLRGLGEAEAFQQVGGDPLALAPGDQVQVRHEEHVLLAGDQTVHGRELPGDTDGAAHGLRGGGEVVARHPDLSAVGADEGGEDLDRGGLAGAVRSEQREHGPGRDAQVDAVEDGLVAVRLAQTHSGDGGGRLRTGS